MCCSRCTFLLVLGLTPSLVYPGPAYSQILDKQQLLSAQSFWDNRDWDWYKATIPFFECPDAGLCTTYYYRWELVTKHLTYGSPNSGYSFTEFIDRPFWSGAYGAISCPAGHQLYEVRWLRDKRYAQDYARYWFRTRGAQPRRYSCWLADAVWAVHQVHPDDSFTTGLLPDLRQNYDAWKRDHFVPEVGLFWQTGHDDGMEININSRQTRDHVRGAPGYRPTHNSYMWADARAIARVARLGGDGKTSESFETEAAAIKKRFQEKLWDSRRQFFLHMARQDEERDGHVVKALARTYETGRYAGSPHGRELIGYVPWQFNLPDAGYEAAWKFLMDPDYFFAPYGPTTVGRRDPLFLISKTCCVWSGQSWPYATTQTLVALANLLNNYKQQFVSSSDYVRLLQTYSQTHRKQGRPYIAEAAHPDTGSWEGHDSYNHSEHYFHSGFTDLIITGLVGLRPRDDETIELNPLAPGDWEYFALDDVSYRGRRLAVLWDKQGNRYGQGPGLHVLVDGKRIASRPGLGRLTVALPAPGTDSHPMPEVNYAVNNEGRYFPLAIGSYASAAGPLTNIQDGNYWYHASPPNRWTCEGSKTSTDWCGIDFGTQRPLKTVKLYFLDDAQKIVPPETMKLQHWNGRSWETILGQKHVPDVPIGRRANVIQFPLIRTEKVRAVFVHGRGGVTGLTEMEAWGPGQPPITDVAPPAGNLALNSTGRGFPKASASHTSRFDRIAMANDGIYSLRPQPHNRWTAYESPNPTDWLEIDLGEKKTVGRVELHLYDDRGGVRAPASYNVQFWDGVAWQTAPGQKKTPESPAGGMRNTCTFTPVQATKIRVLFRHRGAARSGLSEIELWPE